jgi:inosine-uridine nucleoside N-ribohydrolase
MILDVDTGIDEAIAILYALRRSRIVAAYRKSSA